MNKPIFLLFAAALITGGAWLFTSEQSPVVTALGMGTDGDFKSEASWQIDSLVQLREAAHRQALNRPNDRRWSGRFEHSSARKRANEPDYDAEGVVTYLVVRDQGDSGSCTDTFKRRRADRKWELVSDPGADERRRLEAARHAKDGPAEADAAGSNASESFAAFQQRFVREIVRELDKDQLFNGYSRFELTRNVQTSVDTTDDLAVSTLAFDAGSVKGFAVNSYACFDVQFKLVQGRWDFVGGQWRYRAPAQLGSPLIAPRRCRFSVRPPRRCPRCQVEERVLSG